jgi:DNA adenine methylase
MPKTMVTPRPFLKWAGGKGQLLQHLLECVERADTFRRYHEPFVGGGALFFELSRTGRLPKQAFLSDTNGPLIETYLAVRDCVEDVIKLLKEHKARHGEEYFYEVRARVPDTLPERAARIIYLNRTCFNGLYRENSKGEFNVPFGRYVDPPICDEENLRAASIALGKAQIEQQPFETVLDRAKPGDFIYFDPPYHPASRTSYFTSYDRNGFGEDDQRRLAFVFNELADRGVKVLLSNSMTPLVRSLYEGFTIDEVYANRAVNSRGDRRGKISEALVRNF